VKNEKRRVTIDIERSYHQNMLNKYPVLLEKARVEMVLVGPYANPLLGKTFQFINSVNFFLVIAFNVWIHTVELIPPSKMIMQEDENKIK
jgi:hypothetical protein